MTQLLDRPPSLPPAARNRRRWLSENQDTRSVQVGLVLTVILWPVMIWLFGVAVRTLGLSHGAHSPNTAEKSPTIYETSFLEEETVKPKKEEPPPDRFVETNPDAPENIPDKTRNFAAQNQQVAQEKPTPNGKSDAPATEGKKDIESNQIINSTLTPPQEQPPPSPPPTPEQMQAVAEAQAQREQIPLPGFEKIEGENKDGYGSNVSKPALNATAVPEKREGVPDAPLLAGAPQMTVPRIDPQKPQPRKVLDRTRARPAVLADRPVGTQNIGPIAIDARWSQYGQYLQQFIETVQIQWERIMQENRTYPPPGSEVKVKFRMTSDGAISEIISTEGTGGSQYEGACVAGITTRSPYGKWSEEMIAVLGQSQEMTFSFIIQ